MRSRCFLLLFFSPDEHRRPPRRRRRLVGDRVQPITVAAPIPFVRRRRFGNFPLRRS